MRILLHAPFVLHKNTGIARHLFGLVEALARVDSETEFFILWPMGAPWPFSAPNLHRQPLPAGTGHPLARLLREAHHIRTAQRATQSDVFHSPFGYLPLQLNVPSVLTVHDMRVLRLPQSFSRLRGQFLRTMIPRSIRRATRTLPISGFTRDEILALVPRTDPSRLQVAYPGMDAFWFDRATQAERVALRQRLGTDAPFVLAVGTTEPHKNLPALIDAFAKLRQQTPQCRTELVLVGGDFSTATSTLGKLNHLAFVRRPGILTDTELRAAYAEASTYCFPSLYEGLGYPPLEALAQRCPVVAADIPVLREVLGDAARFATPDMLSAALSLALTTPNDEVRGLARARRYDWDRYAREVMGAYQVAVESGAA